LTLTGGVVIGYLDLHHTNYADNIIDAVADGVNGDTGAGFYRCWRSEVGTLATSRF